MPERRTTVATGGKPGTFLKSAIADHITVLKGQLGQPIPDKHPTLRFQRKILMTYVEVCEFLRKGRPLSDEERQGLEDCVIRRERLLAKINAHEVRYGEIRLWAEGAAQRESGNPAALIFSSWDLWSMRDALAEYLSACRLVAKRDDMDDDGYAELGNDLPIYEFVFEEVCQAGRCLQEEIRNGKAPSD